MLCTPPAWPPPPAPPARAHPSCPLLTPATSPGTTLSAWDLDYYTTMARSLGGGVRPDKATPYLHLDSVLAGLSVLLSRLMGVELREEPLGGSGGGGDGARWGWQARANSERWRAFPRRLQNI